MRLTPARRATSSSATRRNPCRSNSTTAASRIAVVTGSVPGIAGLRELVVAQPHWQAAPEPVDRPRAAQRGEPLIAPLLAIRPRQPKQRARPLWQPARRQERRNRVEHRRDDPPELR